MKNRNHLLNTILTALLCLTLFACGTADALNNSAGSVTGPVIPIEEVSQEPVSTWAVTKDVTFSLFQDTYPEKTEKLTMVMENRGDKPLTYGEKISFEKYVDGEWKWVETIDKYFFHDAAYTLLPHSTATFTISPWFLEKPLDEGLYRVTGGETYTDTEHPAWQLEFRIAAGASPDPALPPVSENETA